MGRRVNIRNVTDLRGEENTGGTLFEFLSTSLINDATLPFLLLFSVLFLTLLPCCFLKCRSKRKRSRLSIVADSENTEELESALGFDSVDKSGYREGGACLPLHPPPGSSRQTPAPLTKRNLSVFTRTNDPFTRLESIDEEEHSFAEVSRSSSLKSSLTVEELTATVECLRNSITEDCGGQVNEKVSRQIKLLIDKIKSLKNRSHHDCEEYDSGLALLTPRSHGLSSQISLESTRRCNEVERILNNIRNNAENMKKKIELSLQSQEIDESVVSLVNEEVGRVVVDMLETIPPTPLPRKKGPPSPWEQISTLSGFIERVTETDQISRGDESPFGRFMSSNGEREGPWCPKPKPSREPSPESGKEEEIDEQSKGDTLPSSWRPLPMKKKKKQEKIETQEKPMITWTPEPIDIEIRFPVIRKIDHEESSMMVWTPEPREADVSKSPFDNFRKDERTNGLEKKSLTFETKELAKEEQGLRELGLAMQDVKEDIAKSIKICEPTTEQKDYNNKLDDLVADLFSNSSSLMKSHLDIQNQETFLDSHNY